MKYNLNLKEPEMIKTFNFSVNYIYEAPVIGKQYYSVKRNEALPDFVGSSINYLNTWASNRNIEVSVNYITEGMNGYDDSKDGIITYQNTQYGTLVSSISSISVNVIKVPNNTPIVEEKTAEETNNKKTNENEEETDNNQEENILEEITNIDANDEEKTD